MKGTEGVLAIGLAKRRAEMVQAPPGSATRSSSFVACKDKKRMRAMRLAQRHEPPMELEPLRHQQLRKNRTSAPQSAGYVSKRREVDG